jgi:hypothetical protein
MKNFILTLASSLLLVVAVHGQSDWDTYPERKIFDLLSQEERLAKDAGASDIIISANPFPAKTVVTYAGKKRPAGKYTKSFIDIWVQTRNVPRENAELLVEEHLFKEGGREIWIPVLKMVAPSLEHMVQPDEEILIYYFYLGGYNPKTVQDRQTAKDKSDIPEKDEIRWILAVEKFEKLKPATFIPQLLEKAIDRKMEGPGRILDIWFDPRQVRTRANLVYTGDVRPVPDKRQRLLNLWFENYGFPQSATALMREEARFLDGDKEYWIPVRKTTLDEIRRTVKKGGSIALNTILAGGIRSGDTIDWLFLAGEISR